MPDHEVEHDQEQEQDLEQEQEQEHELDNDSGDEALGYSHSQAHVHEERGGDVSPVRRIAWYVYSENHIMAYPPYSVDL